MLDAKLKSTLKEAVRKSTGPKKRAFIAKVTEDYFDGSRHNELPRWAVTISP